MKVAILTCALRTASSCALAMGLVLPAFAQAQTAEVPRFETDAQGVEDIVVTAQKRSERLQDVPIAITALTSDELSSRSATSTNDIAKFTPNVNFLGAADSAGSGNIASLYIRGIGQSDFLPTADPAVGVYIDDVYLGNSVGGVLDLVDVARVEVLRGPQGTLFGRNTIGGAVSVITKEPEFRNGGSITGTVGNQDTYQVTGIGNVALSDKAAVRVAVDYNHRGTYARSTTDPDLDLGGTETVQVRGQLLVQPTDTLSLRLIGDYYRGDNDAIPSVAFSDRRVPGGATQFFDALAGSGLIPGPQFTAPGVIGSIDKPFVTSRTGPSSSKDRIWGLAGIATWDLSDDITLKSITAYRDVQNRFLDDGDAAAPRLAEYDSRFRSHQFSQELQLSGDTGPLRWVVGAYFSDQKADNLWSILIIPGLYSALEGLPGAVFPAAPGSTCPPADPTDFCAGGAGNPLNVLFDLTQLDFSELKTKNYAGYAQATYDLGGGLSLTLGGRYTREEKRFARSQTRAESGVPVVPLTTTSETFTDFSPKVGLDWKIGDQLLYASFTEGFRSGTFNGRANTANGVGLAVAPERVRSYEAGFKTEWLDRRLRFNGAVFHADYSDIQVLGNRANGATFEAFLVNAAKARIRGVELELQARPVERVDLNASFGYTHGRIREVDPAISALTGIVAGNVLRKTPEYNFSIGGQYTAPLGDHELLFRVDYSWKSEQNHAAENFAETVEPAYGLLDARIAFSSADRNWYVALYGRNLTDETYFRTKYVAAGTLGIAYPQRPREFGLTVRRSF